MGKSKVYNVVCNLLCSKSRNYSSVSNSPQICIVGAGPAGFYAAQRLTKLMPDATVDIYEKLPVPFGLVRYGVAPDHAEVKNVINTFTKIAKSPQVNFYGNITLGKDIALKDLEHAYHAVLLTYGAEEDRKLDIPGEGLGNVLSAREFVGWYNGLPANKDLSIDLDVENVAIVGVGNVAVDIARVLLAPIDKFKDTDITEYSLEQLSRSKVSKVSLIGRRGPLQVAFTIKELREMMTLPGVTTLINIDDFKGIDNTIPNLPRPRKRLTELMFKYASEAVENMEDRTMEDKQFELIFKRTPVQFHGPGKVEDLEVAVNVLSGGDAERQRAMITDKRHKIPCGLAFRSIGDLKEYDISDGVFLGYKSIQAEPKIPFDLSRGVVKNETGRIAPGLYCSGWVSTGPIGVILSTMTDAFSTAMLIYNDLSNKILNPSESKPGSYSVLRILKKKGVQIVSFEDWEKIDREEKRRGKAKGKLREKIVSVEEMLSFAR